MNTGFSLLSWFSVGPLMVLSECLYPGSEPSLICPTTTSHSISQPPDSWTRGLSVIRDSEATKCMFNPSGKLNDLKFLPTLQTNLTNGNLSTSQPDAAEAAHSYKDQ